MATCAKWKVPIVITSLGAIVEVNQAVHGWGGITLHDIINDRFARKAVEKGADGVIAVAAGAGGHAGTLSPFALVQEIRQWFEGPLILSGAIATGRAILAAQAMGADLGYIGSPFIATAEANAAEAYKQGICDGRAADIVYSSLFTGVHGNYLRASIAASGLDPDNLPEGDLKTMDFGGGDSAKKAWRDIWGSGQGIGAIDRVRPAGEYVAELIRQYEEAKAELRAKAGCNVIPAKPGLGGVRAGLHRGPGFRRDDAQKDRSSRLIRLRAGLACGSGPRPPASSSRLTRA